MPKKTLPRIVAVSAGERPNTLRIVWDHGIESLVDVSGLIESFRVYRPLHQSADLFNQVRVGEYGTDIVWSDELDMSADTLWRLAQEQSGATMTAEAFHHWRERKLIHSMKRLLRSASAVVWWLITIMAINPFLALLLSLHSRWIQIQGLNYLLVYKTTGSHGFFFCVSVRKWLMLAQTCSLVPIKLSGHCLAA